MLRESRKPEERQSYRPVADTVISRLLWWAAGLSFAAAVIHGIATPEHLEEWWGYGLFFVTAAIAQVAYGVLLLLRPWEWEADVPTDAPRTEEYARLMYLLGIGGNAAIIALYVVSRTVGVPFLGPEAGEVEPVTQLGLISKATEVALIWCLAALLRREKAGKWSALQQLKQI